MAEQKTNVMRVLEQKKIPYTAHSYPHGDAAVDGVTVARLTGQDPDIVFKTLVAQGASRKVYVFVIPVASELSLKKAAKAVGEMLGSPLPVPNTVDHTRVSRLGLKRARNWPLLGTL